MKHRFLILTSLLFTHTLAMAAPITYFQNEQKLDGQFLKAPKKNQPGIVLIHNWMGITKETEKQAQRFHDLGYNVFVADIYGAGIRPKNQQEAGALAGKYKGDRKLLRSRVVAAIETLHKQPGVNSQQTAVIGYCFGGTAAIESARSGASISATISFHGGLDSPSPADGANIKAKILALHGAIDPYVSAADLNAFEKELQTHQINYELIKYSNTVHSFTDQGAGTDNSKGAAYNEESDRKSFARATDFLKEEAFKNEK